MITWLRAVIGVARHHPKLVVGGGLVVLLLVRSVSGGPAAAPAGPVIAVDGPLVLIAPETVAAGESFDLAVEGANRDEEIEIVIDSGYGLNTITVTPDGSSAFVPVPAYTVPASGLAIVTARQGALVDTVFMDLAPGEPADPVDVYLGPRTVVADGNSYITNVAVPTDRLGNPVAEGTDVTFTVTRPNLVVEAATFETVDLVSWIQVYSRTVAGRTRVATAAGSAGAAEGTFLEVAGIPAPYELELTDPLLPADGQALLTIRTDELLDLNGNPMPDGVVVFLDTKGATGNRRIHSQSIDGRAEFTIEVPSEPGMVELVATASGVTSAPLQIEFESAVESLQARIEVTDQVAMVHVGPVRSVRTSYVPEGTIAEVTAADGTIATADLSLGAGTAFFPADADVSEVTVRVLGSEIVVSAPS